MGSRNWEGPVEKLPLEVIGDILSRVRVARDVIRASLTCKNWQEAYRKHLHALSFNVADDKRIYTEIPTSELEILVTKTIFQSSGLRKLSILMDYKHVFSAASVAGWLMYCRETLSELSYEVRTSPGINVLDTCGRKKLEALSLSCYTIRGVEPKFQRFPLLTSLSLVCVPISAGDLNALLLSLPKLKHLGLSTPILRLSNEVDFPETTVKLCCLTLKTLLLDNIEEFEFILEECDVEYLHVELCIFCSFKVVGSKGLRHFKFSYSDARLLEIEEGDSLEILEIIGSHVYQSNLFPMKIRAPMLKALRIWGFDNNPSTTFRGAGEVVLDESGLVVDLERLAVCAPQLSHLAICCHYTLCDIGYDLEFSSSLGNVVVLEIGCDYFDGFWEWAEKVLRRCPNLRKLIVHMIIQEYQDLWPPLHYATTNTSVNKTLRKYQCEDLAARTSLAIEMKRKYQHLQVEFVYVYRSDRYDSLDDCLSNKGY